jgi:hypothetical protein
MPRPESLPNQAPENSHHGKKDSSIKFGLKVKQAVQKNRLEG